MIRERFGSSAIIVGAIGELTIVAAAIIAAATQACSPRQEATREAGDSAAIPTASEALERSIGYHDPDGIWSRASHVLVLSSARPDGPVRASTIVIDNVAGRFHSRQRVGDDTLEFIVEGDSCEARVNGSADLSAEQIERFALSCELMQRARNYNTYLYGLPMKLRDPGTIVHPDVEAVTFAGRPVYSVKVAYEPEVGTDTWYFYLDRNTYALAGYRFYHDESQNDGEYIVLAEETSAGSLRLPKVRAWYVNADDRYLGTDTIVSIERVDGTTMIRPSVALTPRSTRSGCAALYSFRVARRSTPTSMCHG